MGRIALPSGALGIILAVLLGAAPAAATSTQTWVSSTGSGTTCSRASPCGTFQAAHNATTAGGEILCVDAAEYGTVSISKAISIVCDNTEASILVGSNLTGVTIVAGATDVITLKGLDIEGAGVGFIGIWFQTGAALHVDKVHIRNFRFNTPGTAGILFEPNAYAELYVADSHISDSGVAQAFSGGIVIGPTATGSVNAFISRVKLQNNSVGISADGTGSTGTAVNATVSDCMVSGGAGNGIQAISTAGHAAASIFVDHTVASGNFASAISADGAAAIVRVGDSTMVLNVAGASSANGGVLQSYKNNRISGNFTDGTPITPFPGPGGTPLQ